MLRLRFPWPLNHSITIQNRLAPAQQDLRDLVSRNAYNDDDEFMTKFFKIRSAPFCRYMWCKTHQAFCPTCENGSDFEVGGLPCQPSSRCGTMQREGDPRFVVFIFYLLLNAYRGTLCLILENVKGLRLALINALFGTFWWIYVLNVEPADAGHRGLQCLLPKLYNCQTFKLIMESFCPRGC